jgi:hypothetical protein
MAFFLPPFRLETTPETPAMVNTVGNGDVFWNRPLFKAPPLDVQVPESEIAPFFAEFRRLTARPASNALVE